ncbi:IPT/TIG domain-containing protein, partial [Streptomyces sp. 2MCAF27]
MATIVTLNDTATSSNQGKAGDTLQIQNPAGGLLGTNKVNFGTKTITAGLTVTATQVSVAIPTGLCAGQVSVSVTNSSNVTSNTLPLYIITKPSVTGLSVASGAIGAGATTLNIFGSGFTTATSVAFGTDAATINTITDAVLNVTAPTAAHTMVNTCVDTVNCAVTTFG